MYIYANGSNLNFISLYGYNNLKRKIQEILLKIGD